MDFRTVMGMRVASRSGLAVATVVVVTATVIAVDAGAVPSFAKVYEENDPCPKTASKFTDPYGASVSGSHFTCGSSKANVYADAGTDGTVAKVNTGRIASTMNAYNKNWVICKSGDNKYAWTIGDNTAQGNSLGASNKWGWIPVSALYTSGGLTVCNFKKSGVTSNLTVQGLSSTAGTGSCGSVMLNNGNNWSSPLPNKTFTYNESSYSDYRTNYNNRHYSIDMMVAQGTTVCSIGKGTVSGKPSRWNGKSGNCGNSIKIKYSANVYVLYCHGKSNGDNTFFGLKEGQTVEAGQKIMLSGNTGTEAAHLHFEMANQQWVFDTSKRTASNHMNPVPWLKSRGVDLAKMEK